MYFVVFCGDEKDRTSFQCAESWSVSLLALSGMHANLYTGT
jgi:hypothetical protein